MQLEVTALHSVRRGVGDARARVRPAHLVTEAAHPFDEVLARPRELHAVVDVAHQTELPTLTLCRPELTRRHSLDCFLFLRFEHRVAMRDADRVAHLAELFDGMRTLTELAPVLPVHGVDDEVRVRVVGVAVGTDQHLVTGPRLLRELQRQRVRVGGADRVAGVEGLRVLIKIHTGRFPVDLLREHELVVGVRAAAVDAADKVAVGDWIVYLELLTAVIHDAAHGARTLLVLGDVIHGCHDLSSRVLLIRLTSVSWFSATCSRPGT